MRAGRVKIVAVTFSGCASRTVETFLARLRSGLARRVRQNCRFEIFRTPGRPDWYILFKSTWPERELDQTLNSVATELGVSMSMDPAILWAEMTPAAQDFVRGIQLGRDRPTS
jgi:hypothetical protein